MKTYTSDTRESNKDKIKSGILSILIWSAILLFVFIYKLKPTEEDPDKEIVTTMLVNFGDNRNGSGVEEPSNQEGSLASKVEESLVEPTPAENKAEPKPTVETKKAEPKKEIAKEKVLSGNNSKVSVPKKEEPKKNNKASKNASKTGAKTSSASTSSKDNAKGGAKTANSKTGSGDGKGNAAIGNLIKGRGTKAGSQGIGSGVGNSGDPLGGDGNGDSKVGVDRKLVSYIPGTMGRGGAQPNHSCSASGSITISYTVDKAGNVVSAHRSGGISDPCVSSTSVSWVKKYVKAERANVSFTGTYKITF